MRHPHGDYYGGLGRGSQLQQDCRKGVAPSLPRFCPCSRLNLPFLVIGQVMKKVQVRCLLNLRHGDRELCRRIDSFFRSDTL